MSECDTCAYFCYDEEMECYVCECYMDEDDVARLNGNTQTHCPFYRDGDEYKIARRQ